MSDGRAWLGIIPFALGGPGSSSQDNQALPSSGRLPPVLSSISVPVGSCQLFWFLPQYHFMLVELSPAIKILYCGDLPLSI